MDDRSGRDQRMEALEPYIARLRSLEAHAGETELASRIRVGGDTLMVEAWERGKMLDSIRGEHSPSLDNWPSLIADGIALQAKAMADLGKKTSASEQEAAAQVAGALTTDTAIGLALLEESQAAIDNLVNEAQLEDAKKLTEYRLKLASTLERLKDSLDETSLQAAAELASDLTMVEEQETDTPDTPVASQEMLELPVQAEQPDLETEEAIEPDTRAKKKKKSRVVPVILTVAVVLACLGGVTYHMYQSANAVPPVRQLTVTDFTGVPGLQQVTAQHPSVHMIIDAEAWDGMTNRYRVALMRTIGSIAGGEKYTQAYLIDSSGRALARWQSQGGVSIRQEPEIPEVAETVATVD